ncbi:MAG: hypothetical protein C4519_26860 [Desulfobacteraceae bacterium]|nr:MAG: hypothetical protein C4519_26860 [Desulfobacteraceae bacterium]
MAVKISRITPAVGKSALLLAAALVWIAAGALLLIHAYAWLHGWTLRTLLFAVSGVLLALAIHHFGFLKIADRNLARILPMKGRRCLFAFMSWKSYILVAVMAGMGVALRHLPIPRSYLAVVYIGIGLALVLSSLRYLRSAAAGRARQT